MFWAHLGQEIGGPGMGCTAIDLHPAHHSVKKADFLSDELVLPGGSFDVVSMSLVLSYLPHHSMRRQMIRKARQLLISPPANTTTPSTHLYIGDVQPDAHRAGLLLIAEKASIFKSRSAAPSQSVLSAALVAKTHLCGQRPSGAAARYALSLGRHRDS